MKLTRIDMNSWLMEIGGCTILVDPWLVDPLVFYGSKWLFEAYHVNPLPFTPSTLPKFDLLLISQGLPDHCNPPTLEQLDHTIPTVASPEATKVLQKLGYSQITTISHWQEHTFGEHLQITAVPGALVGATTVENGYHLKDLTTGETIYYEPHLFRPEVQIEQHFPTVDVAIAPVIAQVFPLLGEVVMSPQQAMKLVKTLHPRMFIPTTIGEIRAKGLIPMLTKSYGSVAEFEELLVASGEDTKLINPANGETLVLNP